MSANSISKFNELLNNAHCASEQVDLFDLDSDSPESKTKWNELIKLQLEAKSALIMYIIANPTLIENLAKNTKRFTLSWTQ